MEVGLECPVCFELFKNPMTLRCGHTFCQQCLENFQTKFCATCRSPFEMKGLSKSFALIQAIELIKQMKTQQAKPEPMEIPEQQQKPAEPLFVIGKIAKEDIEAKKKKQKQVIKKEKKENHERKEKIKQSIAKILKKDENEEVFWTTSFLPKRKSYCSTSALCSNCEIMLTNLQINMMFPHGEKLTWQTCKVLTEKNKKSKN